MRIVEAIAPARRPGETMQADATGREADDWRSDDRRWGWLLAAGLLALVAARIAALGANATDLFFDEAQYWSWSLEPALGYYSKPPMVAWLIRLATDACGVSEFCVRLPSPLVHTATAAVIFLLARRLYDLRTAALAGLAFATLPGVSLSSGIISTDVPLLFSWALALLALVALIETRSWWPALLLGLALGLGLNAKYAMAWFVLCLGVYLVATPERRAILRDPRLWVALAIGVLLIAPNLAWNASHSFATFAHTADNARWHGSLLNPLKAIEFFGSQFGVFGPVLFAGLLVVAWRAYHRGVPAADRLLLAFALPVLVVITAQAFVSRAHANWAAVSYVAGTVLVVATLVRDLSWGWLRASFALHVALAVALGAATAVAGRIAPPFGTDPFARTLGWRLIADATRDEIAKARAAGRPYAAVLTDDRSITAELLYYMRDERTPVVTWFPGGRPTDHYELTRPYRQAVGEPLLFVTLARNSEAVTRSFATVGEIGARELPAGQHARRRVVFFALAGYARK
jgi:4-amino-4-deoxy-L-arabinose transferase-like glycosyltransferase